jgi:hypothetical protein
MEMRAISTTWMLLLVLELMVSPCFAIQYCKDFLEAGNPGGWSASVKTFDDEWVGDEDEISLDIWINDVPTGLHVAGFYLTYDPSLVSVEGVEVYDGLYGPDGPWDPPTTQIVLPTPGILWVAVVQPLCAYPDGDGDIIIAKVNFKCQAPGATDITVSTIPGFDTLVNCDGSTVYDSEVQVNIVTLFQITIPCQCEVTGPFDVYTNAYTEVTADYNAFPYSSEYCDNPPVYLYTTTCGFQTGATIDPDTGILTVPPYVGPVVYCQVCAMDSANTDINTGDPVECCIDVGIEPGCCPPPDSDEDGIPDSIDNCPDHPNGLYLGTCISPIQETCTEHADCGSGGYCSMNQEDSYPPQGNNCGDACECEGNFDNDLDVDGSDAATFKAFFGRSEFFNPCTNESPCHGDFDCDVDVDGTDAGLFKRNFSRAIYINPCPSCPTDPWCVYP